MYREYQRLAAADPGFAARVAAKQSKGADPTDTALTWVVGAAKGASQEQKGLVGVLCRGLFSHVFEPMGSKGEVMDPVILDLRNRALAKRIQDWPGERIFITYGPPTSPALREFLHDHELDSIVGLHLNNGVFVIIKDGDTYTLSDDWQCQDHYQGELSCICVYLEGWNISAAITYEWILS